MDATEAVVLCRSCGRMNREEDLFCSGCGSKLLRARICAACGAKNRHDSAFCGACGMVLSDLPTVCEHCLEPLAHGDRFCAACGAQVMPGQVCRQCGTFNRADAHFCSHCGAAVVAVPAS